MKKLLVVFAVLMFSDCPSWGQIIPLNFEGWTSEEEQYLSALIRELEKLYPVPASTMPTKIRKGAVYEGTVWGQVDSDGIVLGFHINPRDPNLPVKNNVILHEYDHRNRSRSDRMGRHRAVLSSMWEEGLATLRPLMVAEALREWQTPTPPRSRSRAKLATEAPWKVWMDMTRDLGLRYTDIQENPFVGCWVGFNCPSYPLRAYPILELAKALCPEGRLLDCPLFEQIHHIAYEQSAEKRIVPAKDLLSAIEQSFPNLRVHGMSPTVYFGTTPIHSRPLPGDSFAVSAWGSWFRGGNYLGRGPANPRIVQFQAWNNSVVHLGGDPIDYGLFEKQRTEGRFTIEMRDAQGDLVCLNEGCTPLAIELTPKSPGTGFWTIGSPKTPGLYLVEARDSAGKVVAKNYTMVTTKPLSLEPEEGVFIWHVRPDGSIDPDPLHPAGWEIVFAGNGLTQARPPAGAHSVRLGDQEFTLTGWPQILRTNGPRRWPVLKLSEDKVVLSQDQKEAAIRVSNINPYASNWDWNMEVEPLGPSIREWLETERTSRDSVTVRIKSTPATERQGWLCFQGLPGISVACSEVVFRPR